MKQTLKLKGRKLIIGNCNYKQWAKVVTAIDSTQTKGYSYLGKFVSKYGTTELPVGTIILSVGYIGDEHFGLYKQAVIYRVGSSVETIGHYAWAEQDKIQAKVESALAGDQITPISLGPNQAYIYC